MTEDDPIAHATTKALTWASMVAALAEMMCQVSAMRAQERAARSRREQAAALAERRARYGEHRLLWEPMLDPERLDRATVKEAGLGWAASQVWKGDPEADHANAMSEKRLRDLRPDVMRLWDIYKAEGVDPVVAMRRAAPLFERPPAWWMGPPEPVPPSELTPATVTNLPISPDRLEFIVPRSAPEAVAVSFPEPAAEQSAVDPRRELLLRAVGQAERFFARSVAGSWVPEYLRGRRLDHTLEERSPWQVGYAPDGWTSLVDHLRRSGFSDSQMVDAGLASKTKRGTVVDRFRGRLMVSVRNLDGETVGFVGRARPGTEDARTPKYLNSPDSDLYHKGSLLMGLHEYRERRLDGAKPVVGEGAFDAMALTAASGVTHFGVAPSGTALTVEQMRLLRQASPNGEVLLALDGDAQASMARAYRVCVEAGWERPRAVVLPVDQDPASLWQSGRELDVVIALRHSEPLADLVVDARLDAFPQERLATSEGRVLAARSAAGVIATLGVGDHARQVGRVAERLNLPLETVSGELVDAVSPVEDSPFWAKPAKRREAARLRR